MFYSPTSIDYNITIRICHSKEENLPREIFFLENSKFSENYIKKKKLNLQKTQMSASIENPSFRPISGRLCIGKGDIISC